MASTKGERKHIPSKIEEEILFLSNHTCCICKDRNKDVQIHHIDGDPSNNNLDNLAVLCLDCHSRVTGSRGLGKSYKPGEVKRYKRAWEKQIQESRKISQPKIVYSKELVSQIDIIVCEILSLPPKSKRIKVLFNILYELNLWRGDKKIRDKILEGLGHLSIMGGLSQDSGFAKYIPSIVWQLCWHFVGPGEVPMSKDDYDYIKKCIDTLDTLGSFTCEFTTNKIVVSLLCENIEHLFEIGCWYERKMIVNQVINAFDKFFKGCYENDEAPFKEGLKILNKSVDNLISIIEENELTWKKQLQRLKQLCEKYKN